MKNKNLKKVFGILLLFAGIAEIITIITFFHYELEYFAELYNNAKVSGNEIESFFFLIAPIIKLP